MPIANDKANAITRADISVSAFFMLMFPPTVLSIGKSSSTLR